MAMTVRSAPLVVVRLSPRSCGSHITGAVPTVESTVRVLRVGSSDGVCRAILVGLVTFLYY